MLHKITNVQYLKAAAARILSIASQFLFIYLLGQAYGDTGTGVYGSSLSAAGIVALVISFGQIGAVIKEMPSRIKNNEYELANLVAYRSLCLWFCATLVFFLPGSLLLSFVIADKQYSVVTFLFASGISLLAIVSAIGRSFGSVFSSETIKSAYWRIFAIIVLLTIPLSYFDTPLHGLMGFIVFGMFAIGILALFIMSITHNLKPQIVGRAQLFSGVKVDILNWFLQIVQALILNIDVLIVANFVGVEEAGLYFVLVRVASLVALPLSVTNPVILPIISKLAKGNSAPSYKARIRKNSAMNILSAVAICAFLLFFGGNILEKLSSSAIDSTVIISLTALLVSQFINTAVGPTSFSSQLFNIRKEALFVLLVCLIGLLTTVFLFDQPSILDISVAVASWRIIQNITTFELIRRRARFNLLLG